MEATLKHYRQAPRKVRLVADLVRGKRVDYALRVLDHTDKRAARMVQKVIRSAVANRAHAGENAEPSELVIEEITVNEGVTLKRMIPRARGRATPINKRTSHIFVRLGERSADVGAAAEAKQEAPAQTRQEQPEEAPAAETVSNQ